MSAGPAPSGGDPSTRPPAESGPAATRPVAAGRFGLGDRLAGGGMGEVYAARDTHLNRDVAVKVLRPALVGTAAERRFLAEARITGQLQHPGIPPVHDLGHLPDGRPFLALKLIKGDTLDALLKAGGPGGRWLPVFEGICQAVGYAHAHGVVHRDLKPANVMVGAFGEVQVMDWGLAKVLADREPPADDPEATTADGTAVADGRHEDDATRAGTHLGTPAYMAPEQAIGAVDRMDFRTDVFGLGAVLCALLTGHPLYQADAAETARQLAAHARLADAFARLDGCRAEPDLLALCKRCLAAEPNDRPADAGVVAAEVAALRAAADDRARRAEVDAAEVKVREAERRKRRLLYLAGSLVGGLGLVMVNEADRQRRGRRADAEVVAVRQAADRREAEQAARLGLDEVAALHRAGAWAEATLAARRARDHAARAGSEPLAAETAAAVADGELVTALDELRVGGMDLSDRKVRRGESALDKPAVARRYADLFARGGYDLLAAEPAAVAGRLAGSPVREQLLTAAEHWHLIAAEPARGRLRVVLRQADPDSESALFRESFIYNDNAATHRLLARKTLTALLTSPAAHDLYARILAERGQWGTAADILRAGVQKFPGDYFLNENLGYTLSALSPPKLEEAVGHHRAAVALRPRSAVSRVNLGVALQKLRRLDEADAELTAASRLIPTNPAVFGALASVRGEMGDFAGAEQAARRALELDPADGLSRFHLGKALRSQRKFDAARTELDRALASPSGDSQTDGRLQAESGSLLRDLGRPADALPYFRRAVELLPKEALAHGVLAAGLVDLGDYAAARKAADHGLAVCPLESEGRHQLAQVATLAGRLERAAARLPVVLRDLDGRHTAGQLIDLAVFCQRPEVDRPADAVALYRTVIRRFPDEINSPEGSGYYHRAACMAVRAAGRVPAEPKPDGRRRRAEYRLEASAWMTDYLKGWLARRQAASFEAATVLALYDELDRALADPNLKAVQVAELTDREDQEWERWRRVWWLAGRLAALRHGEPPPAEPAPPPRPAG